MLSASTRYSSFSILRPTAVPDTLRRRPPLNATSRSQSVSSERRWTPFLIAVSWTWIDTADAADPEGVRYGGFLAPISNTLEIVLTTLQDGLHFLHVPYSYGFSIIILTLIVKALTFPFTKKQVESAMAVQSLKPRIDNIKLRYGEDKDKIRRETSILYDEAGVDPTAGCFPTLATIPILWGLFRTLSKVASEGQLESEGFFWIPSLADGAPPIGWEEAAKYLILPVLLVIIQYYSTSVISPVDPNEEDQNSNTTKFLFAFLPLFVGYFALNVPSGLTLYYFSNTVLTTAQQFWLRRLGGADTGMKDLGPVTKLGMGRRTGQPIDEEMYALPAEDPNAMHSEEEAASAQAPVDDKSSNNDPPPMLIRKRSKRKKLNLQA